MFVFLFAASSVVALLPIWVAPIIPVQDLPGHLATVRVLHDLANETSVYRALYIRAPGPLPNTLFFALTDWLTWLMPLVTASKVVISVFSLALPLSALTLARTLGRPYWLSLFAFVLVYSYPFGRGFVAYAIATPILLFTLAIAHRDAVEHTRRTGILLTLAIAACFFGHAQIYLTAMLLGGVIVILSFDGVRVLARRIVPYLVGSIPFAIWFVRYFVVRATRAPVSYESAEDGFGARFSTFDDLFGDLGKFVVALFPSRLDEQAVIAIGATLVLLVALALWNRTPRPPLPGLRRWTLPILAVVTSLCYALVPSHIQGQASISFRFVPIAALLIALCGGVPRKRVATVALAVGLAAGAAVFNTQVAREFSRYVTNYTGDIEALLRLAEPNRRLAFLRYDRRTYTTLEWRMAWYLDSYYAVYQHGLVQMNFHYTYPNHVAYAPGSEPPRTPRSSQRAFFKRGLDRSYDYLLVYSPRVPKFGRNSDRVELIGRSRYLYLYEIVRPSA